jgi:PAS domain S-box-containing protein
MNGLEMQIEDVQILNDRIASLEAEISKKDQDLEIMSGRLDLYSILIDALPTALYYQDTDDKIILCNSEFETIVQNIREEITGKKLDKVITDPNFLELLCCPDIEPGMSFDEQRCTGNVLFMDGTSRFVEVRHHVFFGLDGQPVGTAGLVIDLTDRKRAESAEIETERLRIAQKLAISVAHELNNPMTIISGFFQLLKVQMSGEEQQNNVGYINKIAIAIERMRDLVDKLMHLTEIQEKEYAAGIQFIDLQSNSKEKSEEDIAN